MDTARVGHLAALNKKIPTQSLKTRTCTHVTHRGYPKQYIDQGAVCIPEHR